MTLKLVFGKLEFLLNGQRLRVGRSEHLDVSIKGDPLVSSNHCIVTNGVLVDAGSTNGTYINSQRVTYNKKVQLAAGDVVTLGETKLFIVDAAKAAIGAGLPDGQTEPTMNARDISDRYVDGEKPKSGDNSNGDASSSTNGTQPGTNTVLMSTLRRSSTERKTVTFSEQVHAQDPKPIPPKNEDESSSDDEVQHTGTGGDEGDDFEGSDEAAEMTENSPHANAGLNAPAGAGTGVNGTLDDDGLTVGVGSPGGNGSENGVGVGSPSDNGNEDPMQWLPKRDSQLGITPMKAATATLPAPLRASDGSTIKATVPPPGISPEAFQPPADAKSNGAPGSAEEQVWSLQQQLQRAEAKYLQLKKKMNFQQRRQNLTQNKARMQKFESKVADLEFQLLYGDTMKDRELTRVSREMKDLEAKLQQASAPAKSLVEDTEYQRVVKELSELKTSFDDIKRKEEIAQAKVTQLETELKDSRAHAEDAETRVTIATRALSELSGDKALARDQKLAGLVTEQVCARVSDQVAGQVVERVGSTVSDRVSQSVSGRVADRLASDVKAVVKQEVSASVQNITQTVTAVQKGFSSVESNVAQLRTILYALAAVLVVVLLLLLMK